MAKDNQASEEKLCSNLNFKPENQSTSLIIYNKANKSLDQLTTRTTSDADFFDNKIIYSSFENLITANYNVQNYLDHKSSWYVK
jgi:hypothetical protein